MIIVFYFILVIFGIAILTQASIFAVYSFSYYKEGIDGSSIGPLSFKQFKNIFLIAPDKFDTINDYNDKPIYIEYYGNQYHYNGGKTIKFSSYFSKELALRFVKNYKNAELRNDSEKVLIANNAKFIEDMKKIIQEEQEKAEKTLQDESAKLNEIAKRMQ